MILHGTRLGNLHTSKGARPIEMRFPIDTAATPEDLGAIPIVAGPYVLPLESVARIKEERYNLSLYQEGGKDLAFVEARAKERFKPMATTLAREIEKQVDAAPRPSSVQLEFVDSKFEVRESLKGLMGALALSLILIAAVLYMQFERFIDVATVMAAIPLGLLGASLSLFVMRSTWSLNSVLGVIMLGGICVNNSILLVSFFHQKRAAGASARSAAIDSSVVRLKPILITSLTTILAMVPIALGLGQGAEVLQPLGISVSGGMLFSTILTLFLIPVLEVSFARTIQS
jgi:HAE1 family hydrophobic/amphiphilic exporter-1